MSTPSPAVAVDSSDITRVMIDDHEYIVIGTAHISQKSVDVVRDTIEREKPDTVAVELDDGRFDAMVNPDAWQQLNLREVIKNKQTTFLVARLALMAFQKRMSRHTGVKPGAEMVAAIEHAETHDSELALIDRDIRVTLRRAWRTTPFWKRSSVAGLLVAGMFQKSETSEDELESLREEDNITSVLEELGEALPEVKTVLVDERDVYMASKTRELGNNPGKTVVVIGAAHKPGFLRHLQNPQQDLEPLMVVPKPSVLSKALPWVLPLLVLSLFAYGFYIGNIEELYTAATAWFLVNGTLTAIGAIIALAHPVTIIAAFIAAPFTSVNPTIGAGMVAGFVQAVVAGPTVRDMESVGDDVTDLRGVWRNRLSRVLLVFVLTSLGSAIGTFASLYWFKGIVP